VGAVKLYADAGAAQPAERVAVQAVGGFAVAQLRPGPNLDAQSPVPFGLGCRAGCSAALLGWEVM